MTALQLTTIRTAIATKAQQRINKGKEMKHTTKTNAMRMLDRQKIKYELREFPLDGRRAVEHLNLDPNMLFKTLVTTDLSGGYYVFCVPTNEELDMKKAAKAVGCKRVEMLKQKDLQPLTGYVHGGCSPVGMKKLFKTVINATATEHSTIVVSAGHLGMLMELNPNELIKAVNATTAIITKDHSHEEL